MKNSLLIWLAMLLFPALLCAAPSSDLWSRWQAHDANGIVTIDHSAWSHLLNRDLVTDHPSGINRTRYVAVTPDDHPARKRSG